MKNGVGTDALIRRRAAREQRCHLLQEYGIETLLQEHRAMHLDLCEPAGHTLPQGLEVGALCTDSLLQCNLVIA